MRALVVEQASWSMVLGMSGIFVALVVALGMWVGTWKWKP